jgi:hypothetical protein
LIELHSNGRNTIHLSNSVLCDAAGRHHRSNQKKGESFFLWWLFGTLLFIVALPLVILMGAKAGRRNQGVKNCPYCGAEMNVKEMECPSCARGQVPRPTNADWERTVAVEDDVEKWAKKENKSDAG